MTAATPFRPYQRRRRFWPGYVLKAAFKVARDPNQTAAGARVVLALDRDCVEANHRRMSQDPIGSRVLADGPTLYELLTDRPRLRALPEGSLGRAYLSFVEAEGISTESLDREVGPVEDELWFPDARRRRFAQHTRASHDLWHVLTGYGRDLLGELLLLAFSYPQLRTRVFGWIVRLNSRSGIDRRMPGARALLADAGERGARAQWLLAVDWEPLLAQPIDEVREALRIGQPPRYQRYVRSPSGFGLVPESAA